VHVGVAPKQNGAEVGETNRKNDFLKVFTNEVFTQGMVKN